MGVLSIYISTGLGTTAKLLPRTRLGTGATILDRLDSATCYHNTELEDISAIIRRDQHLS